MTPAPDRTPIADLHGLTTPEWVRWFQELRAENEALRALFPTSPGASGTVWNDGGVLKVVP